MNKRSLAKEGIWIIIVNGEVYDEYYKESKAIDKFEELLNNDYFIGDNIILTRVLRTTELNEYPNLETTGEWRVYPSIEED